MRTKNLSALAICLGLSAAGTAAEVSYEVRAGVAESDNIARTPDMEQDETIAVVDLLLNITHESRRVNLQLDTDVGYREYTDDTFDSESVGSVNALLVFDIVGEVLTWEVADSYGKLQTDPFASQTPENRETVNNFSTGPDLRLKLGDVMLMELGGRYRNNNFETSRVDNDVLSGRVSFVRALSPSRTISLTGTADRIEFDDAVATNSFDRQAVFLGLDSEMSRGSVSVNLGVNEVHDAGVTLDGFFGNIEFVRNLSPRTTLNLTYDQRLADAGELFRLFQDTGRTFGETREVSATSDPFENRRASVGLNYNRERSSWYLSADLNEEEYRSESSLDRSRFGARAGFDREFGSGWGLRLGARIQEIEFSSTSREDEDRVLSFGLSRRLGRSWDVELTYEVYDRSSNIAAAEYRENRAGLTFGYFRK